MARLVGCFAASHGPLIARDWDRLPEGRRAEFKAAFGELGRRFMAVRPDVLIEVSPDHWTNFFLDNLPSLCIGVGLSHDGPHEPFLKDFRHPTIAGAPELARHIVATALADDFEPSISHRLELDHGFCIPLWRMGIEPLPRLIPITVNDLEPPMMSIRRCIAWGRLIAKAVASYPGSERVAVLASGGLSHSIGEATMGAIDEPFDRELIRLFGAGDDAALAAYLEAALPRTGNGAHEVRNWVIAHAAAGSRGFDLIEYRPVPEVYVGCAYASWQPEARAA